MKILFALTYYRPHVSGLTIYVERLAAALAQRGHSVTVLTSRYQKDLPRQQMVEGVRVIRMPVAARVSKGVLMPGFGDVARALLREHDVVSIHLPQLDAAGIAVSAKLLGTPVVLTYHCDLQLPPGLFNRVVDRVVYVANYVAATLANRIVVYTKDYASHSSLLRDFQEKWAPILPPVVLPPAAAGATEAFAEQWDLAHHRPTIGFVARLATEKGAEVMLHALPRIKEHFPYVRVLYAGQHQLVLGEEAYAARLAPLFEQYREHWQFVGILKPHELAAFYPNCDVVVVPSLNSTESFGLVQVEAMLQGTPSVASDLPGVRQPVRMSGMGRIAPVGDSVGLADAILEVLHNHPHYVRPHAEIDAIFSLDRTVTAYESLFREEQQKAQCHFKH
ncbi:MAG: glycosyltransferase family 4 protein [Herpetosiphonaceae bacterium]|nr:glycosyltransferase family 4 protein [Herpetosiphonaceae bacterium]